MNAEGNSWKEKFSDELAALAPLLSTSNFLLDEDQPHLSGERFLMTRNKLVLSGTIRDSKERVIIKAAIHPNGKREILKEKTARDLLSSVSFANEVLLLPREIAFFEKDNWLIFITEYIVQEKIFVEYEIEQQFFMIIRAFEAQEAFHATTFEHMEKIKKVFPIKYAQDYFKEFKEFINFANNSKIDPEIIATLEKTESWLNENKKNIDEYSNYLIHTDFVPHNFRVKGNKLYVLDCAAFEFGNKYEGWARFLNYMLIHNHTLEHLLSDYIEKNRGVRDTLVLRILRAYKIGYLLDYYIKSLPKTMGDLRELTETRINFWHEILQKIINGENIPTSLSENYRDKRNTLRSPEEKERQKEFAAP